MCDISSQCAISDLCNARYLICVVHDVCSLQACKPERVLYCRGVQPGQARVFRCLAENMNDVDFGNNCKFQIIYKLQRR